MHTRDLDFVRLREVRTITQFHTSLSSLTSIIADVENRVRWFKNCESVTILKEFSPGHFIYQMRIDSPLLVADRELIQEMKITQDPETRIVSTLLKTLPDYLPANDNYIRVPLGDGQWTNSPGPQNRVDIVFIYLNDPD